MFLHSWLELLLKQISGFLGFRQISFKPHILSLQFLDLLRLKFRLRQLSMLCQKIVLQLFLLCESFKDRLVFLRKKLVQILVLVND